MTTGKITKVKNMMRAGPDEHCDLETSRPADTASALAGPGRGQRAAALPPTVERFTGELSDELSRVESWHRSTRYSLAAASETALTMPAASL